jgi:hypothetical protein
MKAYPMSATLTSRILPPEGRTIASLSRGRQARIMDKEGEMNRNTGIRLACLAALLLPACDEEQNPTAPALSSTCEARPASGPAPLAVSFLLNVSGRQGPTTVAINYGDGQTGTNPDTPHSYAAAGSYTASFDSHARQTQSARCTAPVSVSWRHEPRRAGTSPPNAVFKSTPAATGRPSRARARSTSPSTCARAATRGRPALLPRGLRRRREVRLRWPHGGNCRSNHVYTTGNYTAEMCLYDRDKNGKALHDDICKTYLIVVP